MSLDKAAKLTIQEVNDLDDLLLSIYPEPPKNPEDEEHVFAVSMLDGYLTSVLLAPREIPYQQWLVGLWRDDEIPVFKNDEEKERLLTLVNRYYQMLKRQFSQDLTNFEPLVYYTLDSGNAIPQVDLWLDGFERGIEYFETYWVLNQQIEKVIDKILAFDDMLNFDHLKLEERNKALPKLTDLVIQLHALNQSNPEIK
ncbi:UPF0149 family protein [Facilibium subflavum]|uniref:UPF0149 family protein n=1 Tax=Facilibium subflavum TaxID=2219058 RepID=UPI000E65CA42|nr:UPF0149 family protein [Facilibium subflavum]